MEIWMATLTKLQKMCSEVENKKHYPLTPPSTIKRKFRTNTTTSQQPAIGKWIKANMAWNLPWADHSSYSAQTSNHRRLTFPPSNVFLLEVGGAHNRLSHGNASPLGQMAYNLERKEGRRNKIFPKRFLACLLAWALGDVVSSLSSW